MSGYYDRAGNPMTLGEWAEKFEDNEYKRVVATEVGDARVSTVWLGLDHGWNGEAPVIFETMIFDGPYDEHQWRYSTEADAVAGHERIVKALREGVDPNV